MYKNILVILERENVESPAVKMATQLAKKWGAKLHFVAFCYDSVVGNLIVISENESFQYKEKLIKQREAHLEQQIASYKNDSVEITGEVIWEEKIVNWVNANQNYDLVVKTVYNSGTMFHSGTDWDLLRYCPIPICLASSNDEYKEDSKLLVCLDLLSKNDVHNKLNKYLLASANQWAKSTGQTVEFISSLPRKAFLLNDVVSMEGPYEFERELRAIVQNRFKELLSSEQLENHKLHILLGQPEDVISEFAAKHNYGLVMIGSLARQGLMGALLGNTAEKLMAKTTVNMLAVRAK